MSNDREKDFQSFEELKLARKTGYEGMVTGRLTKFLDQYTDFYPDTAHFLYELLQNAEDVNATKVTFKLEQDKLTFEHNGTKRDFTLKDIERITDKGNSDKGTSPDSDAEIGHFGMGFKAVFDYTNTPEIHSGPYHFRIENIVIPNDENVSQHPVWLLNGETRHTQFVLPFNNKQKKPDKAVKEIKDGLQNFNETSLLFLSHIKQINYFLPDSSHGSISVNKGIDGIDFLTSVTIVTPFGDTKVSHWAKFDDTCTLQVKKGDTDEYEPRRFPLSVAFRVSKDTTGKMNTTGKYVVNSTLTGKVCIYFPTENENSQLHFHINAPFASTIARDSILFNEKHKEQNRQLMERLADLTARSLHKLRDHNMLNYAAYSALPQANDFANNPSSVYRVFAERIKKEFENNDLFITENNGYKTADNVRTVTQSIRKMLPNQYAEQIFNVSWMPAITQGSRVESFLKQFNLREFTVDDFLKPLESNRQIYDPVFQQAIKYHHTNPYFLNVYSVLGSFLSHSQDTADMWRDTLRSVCLLPCEDNNLHCAKESVYIRTDYNPLHITNPLYLAMQFASRQKATQQESEAKRFLTQILDICEMADTYDLVSGISGKNATDNQVIKTMAEIIKKYLAKTTDINTFENQTIFLATRRGNPTGKRYTVKAKDCCWTEDSSFFFQGTGYVIAYDAYENSFSKRQLGALFEIFMQLGGKYMPEFTEAVYKEAPKTYPLYDLINTQGIHPTTCSFTDYVISEFSFSKLESMSWNQALLLWQKILTCNSGKYMYACFKRKEGDKKPQYLESSAVYYLKRTNWVPTNSGENMRPCDITESDLPEEFKYTQPSDMLNELFKAPTDEVDKLKKQGVTDHNQLEFASYDKDTQDKLLELGRKLKETKSKKGKSFTETVNAASKPQTNADDDDYEEYYTSSGTKDMEPRKIKLDKEFSDRDNINLPIKHIRLSMVTTNLEERSFLSHLYNGRCQICGADWVVTSKGKHYFEAINIFSTKELDENLQINLDLGWNSLCLCPRCAARFKYSQLGISTFIDQVINTDYNEPGKSGFGINITLENKPETIHFSREHFVALYVAVNKLLEIEKNED